MEHQVVGGRYQIIRQLGGGGFCHAYLAADIQMPDTPNCVVKELKQPEDTSRLATARRLFDREARILQQLGNHDQIPRLLAFFEESEEFYLVEEYIEGSTLAEEITAERCWSEKEAIAFLLDLLPVLEYVHQHQVVHRDIKPSNIIRRASDGKFVLIDFGAVKQIGNSPVATDDRDNTALTIAIGTPGYIPIEQMEGHPNYTSDLFALGTIAIQALTGKQPKQLQYNSAEPIAWRHLAQVSNTLADCLDAMVRPSYRDRYQSAREAIANLERLARSTNPTSNLQSSVATVTLFSRTDSSVTRKMPTKTQPLQRNQQSEVKPWQIAGGLVAVGVLLGIIELIRPTLRPIYYVRQGNQLLADYQPEAAFELFEKVIDEWQPNSVEAWKGRGNALLTLERHQGALAAYEKVLQLQPQEPANWNNKGRVLYQLNENQEALEAHEQAISLDAENAQAWNGKGIALIGLGKFEQAAETFDRAKSIAPQDPTIWQSKAIALEYLGNNKEANSIYEEALAVYDETVTDNPGNLVAWVDRGSVLLKLRRSSEALQSFEKALEINSQFFPALSAKANVLTILYLDIKPQGNPPPQALLDQAEARKEEALAVYEQALNINPQDYQTWFNRGILLAKGLIKEYPEAIKSFEKAIEIRNRFTPAWLQKGEALLAEKRYEGALVAFDRVIDIDQNNPFAWANRGLALEMLKRNSEALNSYDKALELYPDFPPFKAAREQLLEKMGQ